MHLEIHLHRTRYGAVTYAVICLLMQNTYRLESTLHVKILSLHQPIIHMIRMHVYEQTLFASNFFICMSISVDEFIMTSLSMSIFRGKT